MVRPSFAPTDEPRTCGECGVEQLAKEFSIEVHRVGGRRTKCKTCAKARMVGYNRVPAIMTNKRAYNYARRYGITLDEYERMVAEQGNICAICGRFSERRLSIDHCHATGRVRALLCKECNFGLGWFKDSPHSLENAAAYIKRFTETAPADLEIVIPA
jgi:hypothetical protein